MITKFNEFNKINEDTYVDTSSNGPGILGGNLNPGIGVRGSTNGGIIGGADASGDMFKYSEPTTKPGEDRKFRQTVGRIKYKESQKRRNALKKLKELDDTKYDSGELNK